MLKNHFTLIFPQRNILILTAASAVYVFFKLDLFTNSVSSGQYNCSILLSDIDKCGWIILLQPFFVFSYACKIPFRCQFHQHYTRTFFVRTLFWQLFSSYIYVVKAAEMMFIRKIRLFNVDEIDY